MKTVQSGNPVEAFDNRISCKNMMGVLRFALLTALLVGSLAISARGRYPLPNEPKAYLLVTIDDLSLAWNGDQGEGGRGRGEVYMSIWITWPCNVEGSATQFTVMGPLGGDEEFPSGTIFEDPPGSGQYKIAKATVTDAQLAKFRYYAEADGPVATELLIDVLVWEEDSGTDLDGFQKIIGAAVAAAAPKGLGAGGLAAAALQALLNAMLKSGDDALGRFTGSVSIPDACAGAFNGAKITLPLRNLAVAKWKDCDAEDETGQSFKKKGIEPPATIGSLDLAVTGGPKVNKYSSHETVSPTYGSPELLSGVNIGQQDEFTIATILSLDAPLPYEPLLVKYSFFLDVDDNVTTGAHNFPAQGAEYELRMDFQASSLPTTGLFRYNPITLLFEEVPNGMYESFIDVLRMSIFMSVGLEALGNPAGPVAGWGTTEVLGTLVDVLPSDPATAAPVISLGYGYSGVPPLVVKTFLTAYAIDVNRSTSISVTFSKAMNQNTTEAAFSVSPVTSGSFSWKGSTLSFAPDASLQPFTKYNVTVDSLACDRVGTPLDGDADMIPGEDFTWTFVTQSLPLFSCNSTGVEKTQFLEKEDVYVTGEGFPALIHVDIYLIAHDRRTLTSGSMLIDFSDDGFTTGMTDVYGQLSPTDAGSIADSGEFNVVADVNRDGLFDPLIDRVDKTGMGFVVASLGAAVEKIDLQKTVVGRGSSIVIDVTVANHVKLPQTFNVTCYDGNQSLTSEMWKGFWSLGDSTVDGRINQADIDFITANFNWHGTPGENRADINSDGVVNMKDISLCVQHQGLEIWTYYLSGAAIGRVVNVNVSAVNYTTVFFVWNTTGLAKGNYSIGAYAEPVENETDLEDNTVGDAWVLLTITGDITGDFTVDIYDAIILANNFGRTFSNPRWNPNADLRPDGVIDIYDAIVLSNNFNKSA